VFENENPALRSLPLAVQQKQIVVTCNYEARRRVCPHHPQWPGSLPALPLTSTQGLRKLQLIRDAKRICPDAVIVLGEDLTRFRDASKELYFFLRSFSWNNKVERLGFDEVSTRLRDYFRIQLPPRNRHISAQGFQRKAIIKRHAPRCSWMCQTSSITTSPW
jgi:DNA polymerase iota